MLRLADLEHALRNEEALHRLIEKRSGPLGQFLRWAAACETGGATTSLRLEHREDVDRCRTVLPLFHEPWWGVVVYSCFDSLLGTQAVDSYFWQPIPTTKAKEALSRLSLSVQGHRIQSGVRGAKLSLISACEKAQAIRSIMFTPSGTFEDRFAELMGLSISWWGRTTCYDALLRAGALSVTGQRYRPQSAHLLGSSGPSAGFAQLWGVKVTRSTADACERILKRWSEKWNYVATTLGVSWTGPAYDSGDFENALCIFQGKTRLTSGRPDRATFIETSQLGERATSEAQVPPPDEVPSLPASLPTPRPPQVVLDPCGHMPEKVRVAGKTQFVNFLRWWLAASRASTIGHVDAFGGRPCLLIDVGRFTIALNVDTKRAAVETFVRESSSDPERPWRVVRNRRGRINKVLSGPGPEILPGWCAYLTRPLSREEVI